MTRVVACHLFSVAAHPLLALGDTFGCGSAYSASTLTLASTSGVSLAAELTRGGTS